MMVDPAEGGSPDGEVPDTESEWGSMHQELDPNSEADRDYDLYVEDLDSDDSEYGSCFYASIAMPSVQDLVPTSSSSSSRVTYYLSEESMSEPRILLYHEWLLANEWHYIFGIFDRIWFILQEYEPHSDGIHEFPEVYRRPESLINRMVFELAYANCSHYGPNLAMLPGAPNSAFLEWTDSLGLLQRQPG